MCLSPILRLLLAVSVGGWAGTQTSDLTSVGTNWIDDLTVEFTLYNMTNPLSPEQYGDIDYVVLVDVFQISSIKLDKGHVTAWSSSGDWAWEDKFLRQVEVADKNQKYYAPPSLGPGQSLTFRLEFDDAMYIPVEWDFSTHVLAVQPSPDSNGRYTEVFAGFGETWWDKPGNGGGTPNEVVPEASTLIGFGSALALASPGIAGWLRRRRS